MNKDSLYELRLQLIRYPYCQTLRLLYLKNLFLLHDITFGAELRKSTLYIPDRTVLFYFLEGNTNYISELEKTVEKAALSVSRTEPCDRTLTLIDAFLSTTSDVSLSNAEFDYTTDYTSYLLAQDGDEEDIDAPQLKGIELIDGFLEKSETQAVTFLTLPSEQFEDEAEELSDEDNVSKQNYIDNDEDDNDCFTETLAKIYIKQRRYSKALEIIKKLSLKYPKKNAYFADQITHLDTLIINAKSK